MVDVHTVDFGHLRNADADRGRGSSNPPLRVEPLLEIEPFRVVDAGQLRVRREDHGGRDHGARERAHADLVDTRDVLHAGAPQHALEVQHRVEPRALGAVALVALLERLVELAHAVARVALELAQRLRRDRRVRARIALADLLDRQFR